MAKADQIKALIRSHSEGDDARFYAIAMQVAAEEARSGHGRLAQEIREAIDAAKTQTGRTLRAIPLAQPRGDLAGLMSVSYPKIRVSDLALSESLAARIERVLTEQRHRGKLAEHSLTPLRKLLLVGAPGTGKTMTASALACELSLPLFTIQFHGLITKFMGETAAKLRIIFDAIASTRAVYLFDEFDALGAERGSKNDVGEIRRVLNSFLQFLEQDTSESLIISATNHPQLLDRALFRRFDAVIEYSFPTVSLAVQLVKSRLTGFNTRRVNWTSVGAAVKGLSHADLTRATEDAAKNAVLRGVKSLSTGDVVKALKGRAAIHR
jgi:SpoVK/Ycf46/Vps4 family AAA+-type ATPase